MQPKPLTDDEILALVEAEYDSAESWSDELSDERERALDYYYGKPLGNEQAGHSQVVSTDVADCIEWMMPGLVRTFAGSDDLIEFVPAGREERNAKVATKLAHHVFFVENDGFRLVHDSIKDGLLSKTGALKWYWTERKLPIDRDYDGLSEMELAVLFQSLAGDGDEGDIQIIGQEAEQHPDGSVTYNVRVRMMREWGQVEIDTIPPDELRIPRGAKVIDDSTRYVGHEIRTKTRSDLVAEGVDIATAMDLPKIETDWNTDSSARFNGWTDGDAPPQNKMMEVVEYCEHYVLADIDGDGIAERRLICTSGDKILKNEVLSGLPISVWSPVRVPHSAVGRSIADRIMDIQRIQTALLRGTLDNIYNVNAGGRYQVVNGEVNLDDLLTMRPGGIVRTKSQGAMTPLPVEYIGDKTMQVMQMVRTMREERTGVNKHTQGLNAETLHQTATGAMAVMQQGQELEELIARLYCEFCLKRCFAGILDLTARYQDEEKQIRVAGEVLEIDPSQFAEQFSMRVKVGVGNIRKTDRIQALMALKDMQAQALGAGMPFVNVENVYNTAVDLAEVAGLLPSRYWTDPATVQQQPPQEQVNPLVQAEIVKAQSREKEAAARLQLQQAEATERAMLERAKLASQEAIQYTEMELKYGLNVPGSRV